MDVNAKLKQRLNIFEEIDRLANKSINLMSKFFKKINLIMRII